MSEREMCAPSIKQKTDDYDHDLSNVRIFSVYELLV